jgi:cytochrome b involved in lipid metabolism
MSKTFSVEELKLYDGKNGNKLYVLIHGKVYDVTDFDHPGGRELLENNNDNYVDLGEAFDAEGHSRTAKNMLNQYYIGELKE